MSDGSFLLTGIPFNDELSQSTDEQNGRWPIELVAFDTDVHEPKLSLCSCSFHVFALFCRVVAGSSGVGGGAVSTVAVTADTAASGAVVSGNQLWSCGRHEF